MQFGYIPFEYLEASSVEQAISLLQQHKSEAKILAGGTDLLVGLPAIRPKNLIDISAIQDLNYIQVDGSVSIGALTTIADLRQSEALSNACPLLSRSADAFQPSVHDVATIGGNLCNGSPVAELAPALLALQAILRVANSEGERLIPMEDFFVGHGLTALQDDELLIEVQIPIADGELKSTYVRHSIRPTIDFSLINVAVAMNVATGGNFGTVRIALGGVRSTPFRAKSVEAALAGRPIDEATIEECAGLAAEEASPTSDRHGSADYKTQIAKVLIGRALRACLAPAVA